MVCEYSFGEYKMQEFTITKKISKQGKNSIIVVPKILHDHLQPNDLVEINIKILKRGNE
ncbi:hypothetical protein HN652_06485 [archaeon]|jgi:hypothetical protein|nr:hypothetical protein [archaeon]MBT6869616.1 hypothetical protein [archaeon]MBT7508638.1 hypothetical protein [archaeon]